MYQIDKRASYFFRQASAYTALPAVLFVYVPGYCVLYVSPRLRNRPLNAETVASAASAASTTQFLF